MKTKPETYIGALLRTALFTLIATFLSGCGDRPLEIHLKDQRASNQNWFGDLPPSQLAPTTVAPTTPPPKVEEVVSQPKSVPPVMATPIVEVTPGPETEPVAEVAEMPPVATKGVSPKPSVEVIPDLPWEETTEETQVEAVTEAPKAIVGPSSVEPEAPLNLLPPPVLDGAEKKEEDLLPPPALWPTVEEGQKTVEVEAVNALPTPVQSPPTPPEPTPPSQEMSVEVVPPPSPNQVTKAEEMEGIKQMTVMSKGVTKITPTATPAPPAKETVPVAVPVAEVVPEPATTGSGKTTAKSAVTDKKPVAPPTSAQKPAITLKTLKDYGHFTFLKEGEVFALVSLTKQKFYVLEKHGADAQIILETSVSTGRVASMTQMPTPATYTNDGKPWYTTVVDKQELRESREFGGTMPFALELDLRNTAGALRGICLHGSNQVWSHPASHACVRIPVEIAKKIYTLLPLGAKVMILGKSAVATKTIVAEVKPPKGVPAPEKTPATTIAKVEGKTADTTEFDPARYLVWKTISGREIAYFKFQPESGLSQEARRTERKRFFEEVFTKHLTQYTWEGSGVNTPKDKVWITFAGIPELGRSLSVAQFEVLMKDFDRRGPLTVRLPAKLVSGAGSIGGPPRTMK